MGSVSSSYFSVSYALVSVSVTICKGKSRSSKLHKTGITTLLKVLTFWRFINTYGCHNTYTWKMVYIYRCFMLYKVFYILLELPSSVFFQYHANSSLFSSGKMLMFLHSGRGENLVQDGEVTFWMKRSEKWQKQNKVAQIMCYPWFWLGEECKIVGSTIFLLEFVDPSKV